MVDSYNINWALYHLTAFLRALFRINSTGAIRDFLLIGVGYHVDGPGIGWFARNDFETVIDNEKTDQWWECVE